MNGAIGQSGDWSRRITGSCKQLLNRHWAARKSRRLWAISRFQGLPSKRSPTSWRLAWSNTPSRKNPTVGCRNTERLVAIECTDRDQARRGISVKECNKEGNVAMKGKWHEFAGHRLCPGQLGRAWAGEDRLPGKCSASIAMFSLGRIGLTRKRTVTVGTYPA